MALKTKPFFCTMAGEPTRRAPRASRASRTLQARRSQRLAAATTTAAATTAAATTAAAGAAGAANNAAPAAPANAVNHRTAQGYVQGDFFICTENNCGARIRNRPQDIASHRATKHNTDSTYRKKASQNPRTCQPCGKSFHSFHSYESHVRSKTHGHRGTTNHIWAWWLNTSPGDEIPFPLPNSN
ncbi:hypothetical protein F4821DRAFT_263055 [Hypoxylon rubiginosum]|uniref:Uncharacterized protein n=1 Tax=Hypoxylon rubiginosum TaxID=110542 RepID=A0ACC0CT73_9PEZI|nr:hypothetical protein F4821DRAFT_263055 [Hypoxylon rubiginosum]